MGPTNNGSAAQNAYTPFTQCVLDSVDFFNVMTYDAYSTAASTFGAPLYASNIAGYGTYNGTVNDTISDLINTRHVPAGKLVLGIPFYGIRYPGVSAEGSNYGLYQIPTQGAATIPYNQIAIEAASPTATKYCDTGATTAAACEQPLSLPLQGSQEAWIYDTNGSSVITFDDQGAIAAKVKYALDNGLGGVMVWELMQDTSDSALLNAIANAMPAQSASSDPSTYNFERNTQGWTTSAKYTTIGTSSTQAFLGTHSLSVAMGAIVQTGNKQTKEYSPTTVVYVASPAISSNASSVTVHIWIPSTALLSSVNPFIADAGWHYLAGAWTSSFTPGTWNTFQVQVPAGSNPAYLGVEFDSSAFWIDTCYIDSIVIN